MADLVKLFEEGGLKPVDAEVVDLTTLSDDAMLERVKKAVTDTGKKRVLKFN